MSSHSDNAADIQPKGQDRDQAVIEPAGKELVGLLKDLQRKWQLTDAELRYLTAVVTVDAARKSVLKEWII